MKHVLLEKHGKSRIGDDGLFDEFCLESGGIFE